MKKKKEYVCSDCGAAVGRSNLYVKRAVFALMGTSGRTLRSRVVAWLCLPCMNEDADFLRKEGEGVG